MPGGANAPSTAHEVRGEVQALRDRHAPERVPMRELFALAKAAVDLDLAEVEALLDDDDHDVRVVAVSIMDAKGRRRSTSEDERAALFDLYLRRHDRIDTWDLVDRAAPSVLGDHLVDRPREPLYALARSDREMERRSAIVATYAFLRRDDVADTFAIAELLVDDPAELVQKAVGGWVREAGKRDRPRLLDFLDRHAATMPRTALRYAIEHLSPELREHYRGLRAARGA